MKPYTVQGNKPFPWTTSTEGAQLYFQEHLHSGADLIKYLPIIVSETVKGVPLGRIGAEILADDTDNAVIYLHDTEDNIVEPFANLILGSDGHTVTVRFTDFSRAQYELTGIGTFNDYYRITVNKRIDGVFKPITLPYKLTIGDYLLVNVLPEDLQNFVVALGFESGEIQFDKPVKNDTYFTIDEILSDEGQVCMIFDSSVTNVWLLGLFPGDSTPIQPTHKQPIGCMGTDTIYPWPMLWTFGGKWLKPASVDGDNYFDIGFTPDMIPSLSSLPDKTWLSPSQLPITLDTMEKDMNPNIKYCELELPIYIKDLDLYFMIPTYTDDFEINVEADTGLRSVVTAGDESPLEFREY